MTIDRMQPEDATSEVGLVPGVPKLRQATRLRLVDDVVQVLEDAILSGRMRPGDRLLETWIGNELEVSRTTVREALLMLERRGLVESRPRRGTFVTRIGRRESEDLLTTRALLESYAVARGYSAIGPEVVGRLEGLLDEMRACVLPDDVPRLVKIDIQFHGLLIEGANAPKVRELWAGLNGMMSVLVLTALEERHANIDDVVTFHRDLLDGICSGDIARAQEAVVAHYLIYSDFRTPATDADPGASVLATVGANLLARRVATVSATDGPAVLLGNGQQNGRKRKEQP